MNSGILITDHFPLYEECFLSQDQIYNFVSFLVSLISLSLYFSFLKHLSFLWFYKICHVEQLLWKYFIEYYIFCTPPFYSSILSPFHSLPLLILNTEFISSCIRNIINISQVVLGILLISLLLWGGFFPPFWINFSIISVTFGERGHSRVSLNLISCTAPK